MTTKNDFGNSIRNIRRDKNFTLRQVALQSKINPGYLSKLENGDRNVPKPDTLKKIAKGLRISDERIFKLAGLDTIPTNMQEIDKNSLTEIPILGEISCGEPILAVENIAGYLNVPASQLKKGYKYFGLKTVGNSMMPTIPVDSIVTVRMQPDAEDGQIVAALLEDDNSATIKRLKRINGKVVLKPDNEAYQPITLSEDRPGKILGIVISATQKFE